ncbi:MAG: hypothetical protein KGJ90_02450 [Patescibacteria group bacterium]|nr:hypothetical protein [Patescibacteria group bacterium]
MKKEAGGWIFIGYEMQPTCKFYIHKDGTTPTETLSFTAKYRTGNIPAEHTEEPK